MKKRILFLSDSLNCGGSEQSLVSLLNTLDYDKVDVDLWLQNRGGVFEKLLPGQVNIVNFDPKPTNKLRYWLGKRLYSLDIRRNSRHRHLAELLWKRVGRYISPLEKRYDVAISFQQGFPTFFLATKVNANKKAARVNIDMVEAKYDEIFCRRYYDVCDNVIVISDALAEQMKITGYVSDKAKIFKLINVFSVDFIRRMAQVDTFSDGYGGIRLVTTGRLVKQKGYDLAVKAAKILKEKGLEFRWYFIGEGEERTHLESLISEHGLEQSITLMGMKANPYPFMKGCDIYVQTSLFEGFGRTVTEAKILGKAVVSTDFPSVFDQIKSGQNGLICEMTPESIAESILKFVEAPALKSQIEDAVRAEQYTTSVSESQKMMAYLLS